MSDAIIIRSFEREGRTRTRGADADEAPLDLFTATCRPNLDERREGSVELHYAIIFSK